MRLVSNRIMPADSSATIVIVFDFKKNMVEASDEVRNAIASVRYKLPVEMNLVVKTGARLREEKVEDRSKSRRYNFTGLHAGQLDTDPSILTYGDLKTGLKIPAWSANAIARGAKPAQGMIASNAAGSFSATAARCAGCRPPARHDRHAALHASATIRSGAISVARLSRMAAARSESDKGRGLHRRRTRGGDRRGPLPKIGDARTARQQAENHGGEEK